MEYKIIKSYEGQDKLEERIREYLNSGWALQGGVDISNIDGEVVFSQAVIKKSPSGGGLTYFTETGFG